MTNAERDRLFKGWQALRAACNKQHPRGPGGAMMCVCGAACGGSEACSMLATLRDIVRHHPLPADMPAGHRDLIVFLQGHI